MRKITKVICAVAVIVAVTALWFVVSRDEGNVSQGTLAVEPPTTTPEDAAAADRAARELALRQVAATAKDRRDGEVVRPVRAVAPPNLPVALNREPVAEAKKTPPEGYSFTAFHGTMNKAPLIAAEDDAETPTTLPPWLDDANAIEGLLAAAQTAGRAWAFGWVGMASDAPTRTVEARVAALGATVVGRSGDLLRAQLPNDAASLRAIAELPEVAGIGVTPVPTKVAPSFRDVARELPHERSPAFVTLMTGDANGTWRRELTDLGVTVGAFDPAINVYMVDLPHAALDAVVAADYVLAVEPVGRVTATHDSAVPAMGADALRRYNESARLFTGNGGASIPIGVMDTGLNINHLDIASNRRSICGANFIPSLVFDSRFEDQDLWIDEDGHGTHVTGTIAGNGSVAPHLAGMAPLVADIRFAKVLSVENPSHAAIIGRGMDFLAQPSACGDGNLAPAKPLLVNMSLGAPSVHWEGRSVGERKLDATVWSHQQLYVVSAGNSAFSRRGDFASAKNSLTVGAADNNGDIAGFSSYGPTFDGRLKPQVVGTGVGVMSAEGNGSRQGYGIKSGTSMASPAVAGVAALLMEAVPEFREQPAAVRARLMASAVKPDAFLEDVTLFPLHNSAGPGALQHRYGLGKVSARTTVLDRDQEDGWVSGNAIVEVGDAEYGYVDVEVPAGASRMDIAMTWDERAADTVAQPLLNDLDLWVDRDVDCPETGPAACGNAASRSNKDNVEWLILRSPLPGRYRLKVVPKRARVDAPKVALAWTIIRGPSTPQLAVDVDQTSVAAAVDEPFEVNVTLTADGYVAAGTNLRVDCQAPADADYTSACARLTYVATEASSVEREDNLTRTLERESGDDIRLGEVAVDEEQQVKLLFHGQPAQSFRLYFTATAWNASSATATVDVNVGQSAAPVPAAGQPPANDAFADSARLVGPSGSVEFDLLLATPEPGEPPFKYGLIDDFGYPQSTERPRSIWYSWVAPETNTFAFSIAPRADQDIADSVQLDLFEVLGNEALVSLASTSAKTGGGLTFAATARQAYRVRLSLGRESLLYDRVFEVPEFPIEIDFPARRLMTPLTLSWRRASRSANDDFELATRLEGESGAAMGSNFGGTLQPGEFFGELAATAWHRWVAPASGDWRFEVDRRQLRVAVFVGDDVTNLRLVSGEPDTAALFPVRQGSEYHIAVAAADASTSSSEYTLRWQPDERLSTYYSTDLPPQQSNDDIAAAEEIIGLPSFSHVGLPNWRFATVEPGEPGETGSRTVWWRWTAPQSGHYTWSARAPFALSVRLTVFGRDPQGNLSFVAASNSATKAALSLSFCADAGESYWIAAGLPANVAFSPMPFGLLVFRWGPTPSNDALGSAPVIAGTSGTVTGSNFFATVEPGENTGLLGDSSVWWTWEAPTTGWYRFSLNDIRRANTLAIYQAQDGNLNSLLPIATGRRLTGTEDAVFRAEAGVRFAIRVGSDSSSQGDRFVISWDKNGRPAWLRYVDLLADDHLDADGNLLTIAEPQRLAFNGDGSRLYAVTFAGLQVYARDPASGNLTFVESHRDVDIWSVMLWDATTDTLLVGSCRGWLKYTPSTDGAGLMFAGVLEGAMPCPSSSNSLVITDSSSRFLHVVNSGWSIETYRLDDERTAFEFVASTRVYGLQTATISDDGRFVYAAGQGVQIFARDLETGHLTPAGMLSGDFAVQARLNDVSLLAMDDEDRFLFAFSEDGGTTDVFDLRGDPTAPRHLAHLSPFKDDAEDFAGGDDRFGELPERCTFADVRSQTPSADVFCTESVFTVRLLPQEGALRAEDLIVADYPDRYDNIVPPFELSGGVTQSGAVAASPDGKHLYGALPNGILVLARTSR